MEPSDQHFIGITEDVVHRFVTITTIACYCVQLLLILNYRAVDEKMARTVFVGGLPKTTSSSDIYDVLTQLFENYNPQLINFIEKKGIAFVEVSICNNNNI
jgi:hypothetical protein